MIVLAAVALVVLLGLVRIAAAPVAVPGANWASSQISSAINGTARIDRLALQLRGLQVRLVGRGLTIRAHKVSARADSVIVDVGLFGRSVTLRGMRINADPGGNGGTDGEPEELIIPSPDIALADLAKALRSVSAQLSRSGLRRVNIERARLQLVTAGGELTSARVFRDLNAELLVDSSGFTAQADAIAREGRASIALTFQGDEGVVSASIDGVTPTDLVSAGGPIRSGFATAASLVSRVDAEGAFQSADFALKVGPGLVRFARDPIRQLDAAEASFSVAPGGVISWTAGRFVAGETVIEPTGIFFPPQEPGGNWDFEFQALDAVLNAPDIEGPAIIADLRAEGQIDPAGGILHFAKASAELPIGRADAVMTYAFSADGKRVAGAAEVSSAPVMQLLKAWPPALIYEPRKAIADYLAGGSLARAELEFALTPLELDGDPTTHDMIDGGLTVDAAIVDAVIRAPEFPLAVQKMDGLVQLRDKRLQARFEGGLLPVEGREGFAVNTFELDIPRMVRGNEARITANVTGSLSDVVKAANDFEVEAVSEFELSPDDVTGTVSADVTLRSPLKPNVTMDDRIWSVDARVTDAGSAVPIAGQTINNVNVEVLLNARRIAARGRATVDGLTVDVNYNELFSGGSSGAARFVVSDAERNRLGFGTGDFVQGPITITVEQEGADQRTLEADLTAADVAMIVFNKPAGTPMKAEARVAGDSDALDVTDVRVDGGGAFFAGNLAIRNGALQTATINQLALSDTDRARGTVRRVGNRYDVALTADRFDARQAIADARKAGGGGGGPNDRDEGPEITADISARRVLVADAGIVGDLDVKGRYDGKRLASLNASGRFDDTAAGSFAIALTPTDGAQRTLKADLTELGRALSALGIYDRMDGGRTTIDARINPEGVTTGRLVATDFLLTNERQLEAIIARTNQEVDERGRNPLPLAFQRGSGGGGLSFDRLTIDFVRRDGQIQVTEAILRGPVVGGTAAGVIEVDQNKVEIAGTLIPAYGVNNLFGRLPIFGGILGGGDKGGLIGVTFKLTGDLDNPTLVVNPISAIAPGIFRKIFEFR